MLTSSHPTSWAFAERQSVEQVEEGDALAPKFAADGTLPCFTRHAETGEVLMAAFMNAEAFRLMIDTKLAHYWSRSRKKLWKKGETSGMYQQVQRILIDDDQDCVVIDVLLAAPSSGGDEASCHVGYRSCFYREILPGEEGAAPRLQFVEHGKAFDPKAVYGNTPNPTQL